MDEIISDPGCNKKFIGQVEVHNVYESIIDMQCFRLGVVREHTNKMEPSDVDCNIPLLLNIEIE